MHNKYPYTNFHELNADWILMKIREFAKILEEQGELTKEEISKQIDELISSGYFESLVDANVLNGVTTKTKNIIAVENLRAKNPLLDDDELLDLSIKTAKETGINSVILWDRDASFKQSHELNGFSGIDFRNNTITMPDATINILLITPDNYYDGVLELTKISNNGYTITDNTLYGKIFSLFGNGEMSYGLRTGQTEIITANQLKYVDERGNCINTPIYRLPSSLTGTCQLYNIHDYPSNRFVVKNAIINYVSTNSHMATFVKCLRSNTKIENLKITNWLSKSENYLGTAITINHCFGVDVENIYGVNPVKKPASGYALSFYCVSNINFKNIVLYDNNESTWGTCAGDFGTNIRYENCIATRLDSHFCSWGYWDIINCIVNYVAYDVGSGSITIKNTTFNHTDSFGLYAIEKRQDIQGVFDGVITVDSCTFNQLGTKNFYALSIINNYDANAGATINDIAKHLIINLRNFKFDGNGLVVMGSKIDTDYNIDIYAENINLTVKDKDNEYILLNNSRAIKSRLNRFSLKNVNSNTGNLFIGSIFNFDAIGCTFSDLLFWNGTLLTKSSTHAKFLNCLFNGIRSGGDNVTSLMIANCYIGSKSANGQNLKSNYHTFSNNLVYDGYLAFWDGHN